MYSNAYVWSRVLAYLEQHSPAVAVASFFDDAEVAELNEEKLVLYSPSPFRKDVILNRYTNLIKDAMRELFQTEIELVVLDEDEFPQYSLGSKRRAFVEFNSQYTFDTFVVGSSNKHAFSAAEAVAEERTAAYNPLLIYGQSGLGKTHLLYAIANRIQQKHPDYNIVYIKGDQFTNEFIEAVRSGKNFEFRDKYRNADLFLIDDIQFIAGKDATQEEFFHTFNALYEAKKQIVLTSDRPPKEINTLEERMKTRFEWGLLADIQPPDFETRIAIIRDKAVKMSIELPDEVSNYIAENIQSNIRQLEGAVKKIKAMHELMGERITVSLAENAIDALRTENPGLNPTPERIMEAVANYFYIPVEQMISKDRSKDVAYPRQMAMYMIRQELEYSFPDIAKIFKRDHTTVMHACNKIEEERKKSRQTEDVIKKLHNNIRGD